MASDVPRRTSIARRILGRARSRVAWSRIGRLRPTRLVIGPIVVLLLLSAPWLWTRVESAGRIDDEAAAPAAPVVIVLGTEVASDRQTPSDRLAGRLQTAAELVDSGKAKVILVSGDDPAASETTVMTSYLVNRLGVDPRRVVADPYGLDTYDSCARARDVYGVTRALVVSQSYHLPRAVTLCRQLGIDADGVRARCDGCPDSLHIGESIQEYFASIKAAWDVVWHREPAVTSPANPAVQDALRNVP